MERIQSSATVKIVNEKGETNQRQTKPKREKKEEKQPPVARETSQQTTGKSLLAVWHKENHVQCIYNEYNFLLLLMVHFIFITLGIRYKNKMNIISALSEFISVM